MALGRGDKSSAATVAVQGCSQPKSSTSRRWTAPGVATCAMLAWLGLASSASALILSGGPTYTLPGGGSCSISGVTSQSGGATITCVGVNLSSHTKVYFGVRNDINPNGNTMTNANPTAGSGSIFRYLTNTASSITYTSTTSINDVFHGNHAVDNRLVLTLTAGSASVVAAGGNPADGANGDIQQVFRITAGTSFTIRADVQADDTFFAGFGSACPVIYDPSHAVTGAGGDRSRVDVAFYFSDCGDGVVDSPEQCDEGGANGTLGSCCSSTCTFNAMATVCRPGAGAPCDTTETCSGSAADCPTDDAVINMGNVCRMGSGDVCDQNELCTGVPGQVCPPDDAPGNTTIQCRVSTTGDVCDLTENCSGAPGAVCPPDDAPMKMNFLCRPGSGDVCDPEERCTGLVGQGCPADVVAPPTTVCRTGSGDSCDPNETCTAIPGQMCPANVVTPGGTQCRAAANSCDVAEVCSGTALQTCPVNGFVAATTPCNQDNNLCTVDECNGSGACVFDSNLDCADGNLCTQDSCAPLTGCGYSGAPSNSCATASKAILKIKQSTDDRRDSARFLWRGGPSLVEDMGDPTQTTRYELCIYDGSGNPFQLAMGVPGGAGWEPVGSPTAPRGFKYKDLLALSDGVKLIKTKGSSLDKAKLKVIAKGNEMRDTATHPFQYPVTAQLYASDGMCWEAQFNVTQTKKNLDSGFSAKLP